jgi:hypothetical protein
MQEAISPMLYRELAPAAAAALAGDSLPLARLKYEYATYWAIYGSVKIYSAGQNAAVVCADYSLPPPLPNSGQPPYDPASSTATREAWWSSYKAFLPNSSEWISSQNIFTPDEWLNAYSVQGAGGCAAWPGRPGTYQYPLSQSPKLSERPDTIPSWRR